MSRYPHIPTRDQQRPLFAPGIVQGYRVGWLGTPAQRRELLQWAKWGAAWLVVSALAALAVGVLTTHPLGGH